MNFSKAKAAKQDFILLNLKAMTTKKKIDSINDNAENYFVSQLKMAIALHNEFVNTGSGNKELLKYCIDTLTEFLKKLKDCPNPCRKR
jgi:hypothetical protein